MRVLCVTAPAAAIGVLVSAASGQTIASFAYNALDGQYTSANVGSEYVAQASAANGVNSSGSVARQDGPGGTAFFDQGFVADADDSDVVISLSVDPINATTANGLGSLAITDINGDTITADIEGTWVTPFAGSNFIFYDGIFSNVAFNDMNVLDGFEGQFGNTLGANFLEGDITGSVSIQFLAPEPVFFGSDFTAVVTNAIGSFELVPTPGVLAAFGGVALVGARRRR
ncbi:MAG: hypothetical protein AAGK04_05985 [Planctomycetota bacterium]